MSMQQGALRQPRPTPCGAGAHGWQVLINSLGVDAVFISDQYRQSKRSSAASAPHDLTHGQSAHHVHTALA